MQTLIVRLEQNSAQRAVIIYEVIGALASYDSLRHGTIMLINGLINGMPETEIEFKASSILDIIKQTLESQAFDTATKKNAIGLYSDLLGAM